MSKIKDYPIVELVVYEGKYLGDDSGVFILNTHKIDASEALPFFEDNKFILF